MSLTTPGTVGIVEIEPRPPGPLTDAERAAAAERLADAAGANAAGAAGTGANKLAFPRRSTRPPHDVRV